jgi:hypothetical protein
VIERMLLIACGVAVGWMAAKRYTVPWAARRGQTVGMALSLGVGLLFVAYLASLDLSVVVTGSFYLALSAGVAYAGHARQVNKKLAPVSRRVPQPPATPDECLAVILVADGDPAHYDSPLPWAERLRQLAAAGDKLPHWLARLPLYARIRTAYQQMGDANPVRQALAQLGETLATRLGAGFTVGEAHLLSAPLLIDELARLAGAGYRRALLVPVGFLSVPEAVLRDQVEASFAEWAGMAVRIAPALPLALWNPGAELEQLRRLLRGETLSAPPAPEAEAYAELERLVGAQNTAEAWNVPSPAPLTNL